MKITLLILSLMICMPVLTTLAQFDAGTKADREDDRQFVLPSTALPEGKSQREAKVANNKASQNGTFSPGSDYVPFPNVDEVLEDIKEEKIAVPTQEDETEKEEEEEVSDDPQKNPEEEASGI